MRTWFALAIALAVAPPALAPDAGPCGGDRPWRAATAQGYVGSDAPRPPSTRVEA